MLPAIAFSRGRNKRVSWKNEPFIPTPPPPRERLTHTPPNPRIAFPRAPPYGDMSNNVPRRQAAARARRAKPGAKRRQARAQRRARQGGLRVGVGGRCNQTKPPNPPNPPATQHPRQRAPFDGTPCRAFFRARYAHQHARREAFSDRMVVCSYSCS